MQLSCIGEQLPCTREPGNSKDPFAMAVVRSSVTVSQQLRTIMSARTTARGAGGGRIRLGVANQNPQSAKIISAKFCERPIRENFVPRKFGAIRYVCLQAFSPRTVKVLPTTATIIQC